MLPNIGILQNGALITKLLNKILTSCSLMNLDFLPPNIADFDNRIILPLITFEILGFIFSVFFLHFKHCDCVVLYLRL